MMPMFSSVSVLANSANLITKMNNSVKEVLNVGGFLTLYEEIE